MRSVKLRKNKLEVGVMLALLLTFSHEAIAQDSDGRVTGCLDSDGDFSRFALGDDPVRKCTSAQDEVALKLDDSLDAATAEPFFVTLRLGDEQVIAAHGALELRARCLPGSTTSGDALELLFTSGIDGWFATSAGTSTARPLLAREEIILFTARAQPDQGRFSGFKGDRLVGAQLALAPDGSFIALATGSTAFGVHLFGQDCLVVGAATLIQGDLPPPRAISRDVEPPPDQISGGPPTDQPVPDDTEVPTENTGQISRSSSNDGGQRGIGAN